MAQGGLGHIFKSRTLYIIPRLPCSSLYDPSKQGSYNYDNCGLLDADSGEGYLPKERYANYSEFIEAIKPPYFEKVKWEVIDDDEANHAECFSAGTASHVGMMTFAIALLARFLQ